MSDTSKNAQKILSQSKGLSQQLQTGEEPVLSIPAIWDSDERSHSEACDVILTDRRLIGFYYKRFPREFVFFEALDLSAITHVTLRQKTYQPVFREIVVSQGMHKVSIRMPRHKSEVLYAALCAATSARHGSGEQQATSQSSEVSVTTDRLPAPVYGREDVHTAFDTSPLAIILLFVGGIVLEIVGVILWSVTQSSPIGLPLCIAGFVAVCVAILQARKRTGPKKDAS
jgi:F0F1-type ATP synthase assembly protein I